MELTTYQQTTINQITSKIKKFNPSVMVEIDNTSLRNRKNIERGHVALYVIEETRFEFLTYADVEINTKGKVTIGNWHHLTPIKTRTKRKYV